MRFAAAALLATILLALAACGGSDEEGAATTGAFDTGTGAVIETEPSPETAEQQGGGGGGGGKPFQITVPASAPIGPTSPPRTIKQLQRALKMLGYAVGTPDGIWGDKTRRTVRRFQRDQNLEVDGLVGGQTAREINRALRQRQA